MDTLFEHRQTIHAVLESCTEAGRRWNANLVYGEGIGGLTIEIHLVPGDDRIARLMMVRLILPDDVVEVGLAAWHDDTDAATRHFHIEDPLQRVVVADLEQALRRCYLDLIMLRYDDLQHSTPLATAVVARG